MTDDIAVEAMLEPSEPDVSGILYTAYLTSIDEVIEHVNAADTLGLGFRVESYAVSDEDAESAYGEFEFTLLNHMPTRAGNGD